MTRTFSLAIFVAFGSLISRCAGVRTAFGKQPSLRLHPAGYLILASPSGSG